MPKSPIRYDLATDSETSVGGEDTKQDCFGRYALTNPDHPGYNWRQTCWRPGDKTVSGAHDNFGYLFF